jgi:starch-binding outer membrane protein, SusD/RagB family
MRNCFSISFLLLVLSACTEAFLEIEPHNGTTDEFYYKTEDHANAALVSAYDPLHWPEFYGVWYWMLLDGASDDALTENADFDNFNSFSPDNTTIQGLWNILYMGVFRCNIVLEKVPSIHMDETRKNRILAEAHFLRALYDWHIVTNFGEAPLVNRILNAVETSQPKNSKTEFWHQIESDLRLAIPLLPEKSDYDTSMIGHATRGAALTLLGKSYLYQERWAEARTQFELVISSGEYQLQQPASTDSADVYNAWLSLFSYVPIQNYGGENNCESIFEIQCNTFISGFSGGAYLGWGNAGTLRDIFINSKLTGYNNIVPSQSFVDEFEPGDLRKRGSVWLTGDTLDFRPGTQLYKVPFDPVKQAVRTGYNIKKTVYPIWYNPSAAPSPNNWRIFRYTDVLLMYAECLNWTGGDPLHWINLVRARVGLGPTALSMPQALIHERRVELGFEIQRFHDLIRWSSPTINWVNVSDFIPDFQKNKHEYLPIPQKEIDLAGGILIQNPAYTK